jgi:hypothetical protein
MRPALDGQDEISELYRNGVGVLTANVGDTVGELLCRNGRDRSEWSCADRFRNGQVDLVRGVHERFHIEAG